MSKLYLKITENKNHRFQNIIYTCSSTWYSCFFEQELISSELQIRFQQARLTSAIKYRIAISLVCQYGSSHLEDLYWRCISRIYRHSTVQRCILSCIWIIYTEGSVYLNDLAQCVILVFLCIHSIYRFFTEICILRISTYIAINWLSWKYYQRAREMRGTVSKDRFKSHNKIRNFFCGISLQQLEVACVKCVSAYTLPTIPAICKRNFFSVKVVIMTS